MEAEKPGSVALTGEALQICRRMADTYRVSQSELVKVALQSFDNHINHSAAIQLPALVLAVSDLHEQVALLIDRSEQLEELCYQLLAAEAVSK